MSEGVAVRGVVVGHGALAEGIVDAVRQVTGVGEEALIAVSNRGLTPEALVERLRSLVGEGPTILFVDLPGGSCAVAARRVSRERGAVAMVSGVNLPLLVEFVLNRGLPLAELVPRLVAKGCAGIASAPADWESHADRAVSGR